MKKLAVLILLLAVSLKSFSQEGTQKDECYICLDSIRTRDVIKDLITGDAAIEENNVLKDMISNLQAQVSLCVQNTIDLEKKASNLQQVNKANEELITAYKAEADNNAKLLQKEKSKSTFYKISTIVALIGSGVILIAK